MGIHKYANMLSVSLVNECFKANACKSEILASQIHKILDFREINRFWVCSRVLLQTILKIGFRQSFIKVLCVTFCNLFEPSGLQILVCIVCKRSLDNCLGQIDKNEADLWIFNKLRLKRQFFWARNSQFVSCTQNQMKTAYYNFKKFMMKVSNVFQTFNRVKSLKFITGIVSGYPPFISRSENFLVTFWLTFSTERVTPPLLMQHFFDEGGGGVTRVNTCD